MPQDQRREAAWIALHTPTTDAAQLARIASAHPEFATAIGAHRNAYPELRAWAEIARRAAQPIATARGTTPAEPLRQAKPERRPQPVEYRDPAAIPLVEPRPGSQFAAPKQGTEPWHQPEPSRKPHPQLERSWDYSQYTDPHQPGVGHAAPQPLYSPPANTQAVHTAQIAHAEQPAQAARPLLRPVEPTQAQPIAPPFAQRTAPQQSPGGRVNVLGIIALSLLALTVLSGFVTPLFQHAALLAGRSATVLFLMPLAHLGVTLVAVGLAIGGVVQRSASRMRWTAVGALVAGVLGTVSTAASLLGSWALSLY